MTTYITRCLVYVEQNVNKRFAWSVSLPNINTQTWWDTDKINGSLSSNSSGIHLDVPLEYAIKNVWRRLANSWLCANYLHKSRSLWVYTLIKPARMIVCDHIIILTKNTVYCNLEASFDVNKRAKGKQLDFVQIVTLRCEYTNLLIQPAWLCVDHIIIFTWTALYCNLEVSSDRYTRS